MKIVGNCTAILRSEYEKPTDNTGIRVGGWEEARTFQSSKKVWLKLVEGYGRVLVDEIVFDSIYAVRVVEPAKLLSVSSNVDTVNVGEKVTVTWTFDKAPLLEDLSNVEPVLSNDNLTEDGAPGIVGSELRLTLTGAKQGTTDVSLTVDGVTKSKTITIAQPA